MKKVIIIAKTNLGEGHLVFGFYSTWEKAEEDYNKFSYLKKNNYSIINISIK